MVVATPIATVMPDMTNQTIDNGRLRFMEKLGEGGYGVVYRAVDESAATSSSNPDLKEFAIKVLPKSELAGHHWQFQGREIAIHKFVSKHPNVLTLHEVIEDDWFIYIVLDYCPGGDLFSAIIDRHLFCGKNNLVKEVFVQILDAVEHCHDKGISHRDLKPENILCNKDCTDIRLGDFGLATNSRMSNSFGCGSSYYVSPECIGVEFKQKPYPTQQSDIWALGIILTNMIAGRSPWSYATTNDGCFLRFMANPNYLREMLPISEGASDILKRIFTFDPYARITIPELREEILKLDVFFMTAEEIERGNKFIKYAAASYSAPPEIPKAVQKEVEEPAPLSKSNSRTFLRDVLKEDRPSNFAIASSFDTPSTTNSDSSSGDESGGPVTPATYAVDSATIAESKGEICAKEREHGVALESLAERLEQIAI